MSDSVSKLTLGRAKAAVLARDFALAEELFKSLLVDEPESLELLGELGSLYLKTGRDEDALAVYKQIMDIDPRNLDAINNLGSIYRKLKRYRDSVSILEQGIILDENNIQLFYNLGFTYKDMEKYPGAIHCFEMVIAQNKDDVLAYNHLGSIYILQGDYGKAVDTLKRGLKIDQNHPVLHLNLARAYEKVGNNEAASLEYEAALRSRPGWLEAIDGYADLLLSKDNASHAQVLVGQALSLNPEHAGMHTKMGHIYSQLDSFTEAESQYTEALALEPDSTEALSGLADAYESDGKIMEALHTMEKYENLSPESIEMLQQYTHILLTGNKLDAAHEKIMQVWNKQPDDVRTLNLLGQYYICSGEETKADGCFDRIRSIDPSYVAYYKDGAMRYDQKGEHVKAEQSLKKYLDVRPYDSRAVSMLADNYEKQSRLGDAKELYGSLAEKNSGNPTYKQKLERVGKKIAAAAQPHLDEAAFHETMTDYKDKEEESFAIDVDEPVPLITEEDSSDDVAALDLGYNLESLTQNDENISPFENTLDDEIEASRHDDNSLDALISPEDKLDRLEDEASDEFFRNNPAPLQPPAAQRSEEKSPVFESEDIDDNKDDDEIIGLDEDVQKAPEKKTDEPKPQKLQEPESVLEPEPEFESIDDVPETPDDELPQAEEPEFESDDVNSEEEELIPEMEDETPELLEEDVAAEQVELEPEELTEEEGVEELPEAADVQEAVTNPAAASAGNDLVREFAEIADSITDSKVAEKYKKTTCMLKSLRDLTEFLPEDKKALFMQSEARMQLEWIIQCLEGRPGLMALSDAWRNKYCGSENIAYDEFEFLQESHGSDLVSFVLEHMRVIINSLKDKQIAAALDSRISSLLGKL